MERWRLNTVTVKQQLCALQRVPANLDRLAELGITPELSGIFFVCVFIFATSFADGRDGFQPGLLLPPGATNKALNKETK